MVIPTVQKHQRDMALKEGVLNRSTPELEDISEFEIFCNPPLNSSRSHELRREYYIVDFTDDCTSGNKNIAVRSQVDQIMLIC